MNAVRSGETSGKWKKSNW